MSRIVTDHHSRDWHWTRMAGAPKAVVCTPRGRFIVALTEHNPADGPGWVGVPATQDADGNWVQTPSPVASSCAVMNRDTVHFVA